MIEKNSIEWQQKFEKYKIARKKYLENHTHVRGYFRSYIWHAFLLPLLKLLRVSNRQKITVIGDDSTETSKPKIYACTHIGFYDIMILFEVIKRPCWLFWGNPNEDLTTLFGWMALKNGAILVDSYDKEDRKIAKKEAEYLLEQGGSLMIFPEGAWNITDNEPVMKLFPGTVSMAKNTGAEIIPVAIEQYDKHFFVNIGKNIDYKNDARTISEITRELRDILASLKWNIWEQRPIRQRKTLPKDMRERFVKSILDEAEGKYTYQMIQNESYHDKIVVLKDEAFSFLKTMEVKKENAFLLR